MSNKSFNIEKMNVYTENEDTNLTKYTRPVKHLSYNIKNRSNQFHNTSLITNT